MSRKITRLRFDVRKQKDGFWYVSIDFGNGCVFASATGYNRKRNAVDSARSVMEMAQFAELRVYDADGAFKVLKPASVIDTGTVRYP
jgi:uncharacterized protein YegP (UPF0339 family)